MTDHPVIGLNDVVHQRVRLGILAVTHEAKRVEFGFLRATLDLTAGNLSQHLGILERAGLIELKKATTAAARAPGSPSPRPAARRCATTRRAEGTDPPARALSQQAACVAA